MPDIIHSAEQGSDTNAALRWTAGILLSGILAAAQNWFRRRSHEKQLHEQAEEFRKQLAEHTPPTEPSSDYKDDLKDMLEDLQRDVQAQGHIQDDRHTANIARFTSIEASHRLTVQQFHDDVQSMRADYRQGRTEVEGLRDETRQQTGIMRTILAELGKIGGKEHKPRADN